MSLEDASYVQEPVGELANSMTIKEEQRLLDIEKLPLIST